jgi:hypothetical protein
LLRRVKMLQLIFEVKAEVEQWLRQEYLESIRAKSNDNSVEDDAEMRFVLDDSPSSGTRVLGAWVHVWTFYREEHWLAAVEQQIASKEEEKMTPENIFIPKEDDE